MEKVSMNQTVRLAGQKCTLSERIEEVNHWIDLIKADSKRLRKNIKLIKSGSDECDFDWDDDTIEDFKWEIKDNNSLIKEFKRISDVMSQGFIPYDSDCRFMSDFEQDELDSYNRHVNADKLSIDEMIWLNCSNND